MPFKRTVACIIFIFSCCACFAQDDGSLSLNNSSKKIFTHVADDTVISNQLLTPIYFIKIDSIAHSAGAANFFAQAYTLSMQSVASQINSFDSASRHFIEKFEETFAAYFLQPYYAYHRGTLSDTSAWKFFYDHQELSYWQHVLMGVNTHINADIWRSLVDNFSEEEIRKNKKQFLSCRASIAITYSAFFDSLAAQSHYVQFISSFTAGLAPLLGKHVLYKWRRRSINLAILYYRNPKRFQKKLAIINRKKQRIDQLISKN